MAVFGANRGPGHSFVPSQAEWNIGIGFAAYVLVWLAVPVVRWSRIKRPGHVFLWGIAVSVGGNIACLVLSAWFLRGPQHLTLGIGFDAPLPEVIVAVAHGAFAVTVWSAALGWCLVRGVAIVRQTGTLCPTCAYNLAGNTSMTCPECGSAFTFDDLDTTEATFKGRVIRARDAAAAPIGKARTGSADAEPPSR